MTTSRREFFKTAAMGAVGAGAAFGTVAVAAAAAMAAILGGNTDFELPFKKD